MDILFTPRGLGARPSSAMGDIERRTASFQRMLELEKTQKTERLQSTTTSPPASPPPPELQDHPSLQLRRADLSQQQNNLMLKAVRRSIVLPALSITIPQPAGHGREDLPEGPETETERGSERDGEVETPTAVEPLHKQVKFLAPDDEDDDMSDQSSICQSPSWEGYGQRKKEKKKEADRRRKEKEQADKEAKAAKKRSSSRLNKSPPPSTISRNAGVGALSNAERSMSDPLLISHNLLLGSQVHPRPPQDVVRAASADDLQQTWRHRPGVAEVLSDSETNSRRSNGNPETAWGTRETREDQHSPTIPTHLLPGDDGANSQRTLRESYYTDVGPAGDQVAPTATTKPEPRSPREAFPPSASRTPLLRHMSISGHSRSNNAESSSTSSHSQDSQQVSRDSADRGRKKEDRHVRRQREQSRERAMAGLADDYLIGNISTYSSSTRSSSRHTQHTRRSSLTQDAKAVAMKLAGFRSTPAKEEPVGTNDSSSQNDYFNFMERSYSSSNSRLEDHLGTLATTPGSPQQDTRHAVVEGQVSSYEAGFPQGGFPVQERPATSHSSVSSKGPSIAGSVPGNHGKKGRSLKDAARAALNMSKGALPAASASRQSVSVPPYSTLRTRMQSQPNVSTAARVLGEYNAETMRSGSMQPPSSNMVKSTEVDAQTGSRISEGSSSSSAYEDGSPLPSPVTTPDTSRPQSARGIPLATDDASKGNTGSPTAQDDERTLRQSYEASEGSDMSITPRLLDNSGSRESMEMADEDRWSRTALPLEIDCDDAQSFTTSVTHIDKAEHANTELSEAPAVLVKSLSNPDFRGGYSVGNVTRSGGLPPIEHPISIPPRSKKREQAAADRLKRFVSEQRQESKERNTNERQQTNVVGVSQNINPGRLAENAGSGEGKREKPKKRHQKERRTEAPEKAPEQEPTKDEKEGQLAEPHRTLAELLPPASLTRASTSSSAVSNSSTLLSAKFMPPVGGFAPSTGFASNPGFVDFQDPARITTSSILGAPPAPQNAVPSSAAPTAASRPQLQSRTQSVPAAALATVSTISPPTGSPAIRPVVATPVSILKQPTRSTSDPTAPPSAARPHVLSALPKHMQLQAGISPLARPPPATTADRTIGKMFVECCSCKFYHDMPSKLYECMAKPDKVVEDRALGISGAITTMVKCPWCQHNMSTSCCAGYMAVVVLKERLH
ncbi:hypothetical protein B0T24DRAFT_516148 [Lasiosphaeria ovina]|uniref:Uncharacterized protein n=1 Tax=Lasiosphaeria ovina TaxID=92902 RepID=A0AAE0TXM5_9PEZI|nr:hypothetical protein B0T24DRAFT_516148 [Lasiosphaeria ovina]